MASPAATACGTVKETVTLMLMPRYVASSIASMPTAVAGILTMMFGAREAKCSAWATRAAASRRRRGSVCIESRPLRPRCSTKIGSRRAAASTDSSSTTCHPISASPAVGCSAAISAIRACQRGRSERIAASAMTGLHVAPTAPQPMAAVSSVRVELSFHRAVGVVSVIVRRGEVVTGSSGGRRPPMVGTTPGGECINVRTLAPKPHFAARALGSPARRHGERPTPRREEDHMS